MPIEIDKAYWETILQYGAEFYELDWFAADEKGQLAIFSGIRHSPIPKQVLRSYENYVLLKAKIDQLPVSTAAVRITRESGVFDYSDDYSAKGLFAFDFRDASRQKAKNQFDLISRPALPLTLAELELSDELMNYILRIDWTFDKGDMPLEKLQ